MAKLCPREKCGMQNYITAEHCVACGTWLGDGPEDTRPAILRSTETSEIPLLPRYADGLMVRCPGPCQEIVYAADVKAEFNGAAYHNSPRSNVVLACSRCREGEKEHFAELWREYHSTRL